MRRTKIVATIGPAVDNQDAISKLIDAGMNIARVNMSHGSHEDHAKNISYIRKASAKAGVAVAILLDLQGPKIRTGALKDGEFVNLEEGQTFKITTEETIGTAEMVSTTYKALPGDVVPGDQILISDGLLELKVLESTDTVVTTEVIYGGLLKERQGINLPGVKVSAPACTEKDYADLEFGLQQGVDYVALSFVRKAEDIQQVQNFIVGHGKNTPVIAKIEKPEAVEDLEKILDVVDGVMVARGDLGVEMSAENVPPAQKKIIKGANERSLPVITATQMLESMIQNPRCTRAEASDVANAILDGCDAVMLSGETAMGKYPFEAVKTMDKISRAIEPLVKKKAHRKQRANDTENSTAQAICASVATTVDMIKVDAIWIKTESGNTARLISHFRPDVPVYAFTPSDDTYRRMALHSGVRPIKVDNYATDEEFYRAASSALKKLGLARPGDTIVTTGSSNYEVSEGTDFMKIKTVS